MERDTSMYQIKNVAVILLVGILSFSSCAAEISNEAKENYQSLVVKLSNKIAELDKAVDVCTKRSKVSEKAIQQCNLKSSAVDGLLYVNFLAENKCTKELQIEVLSLLVKERNYRNHYQISPDNWKDLKQETLKFFDTYLAHLPLTSDQSVDLEQVFLSIPNQQQVNLLNCKALQQPFDVLQVADSFAN